MSLVAGVASFPDILRFLALPVFGWAAYRDVRTRRVPNRIWIPLATLGVLALVLDVLSLQTESPIWRALFYRRVLVSVVLLLPSAYLLWWIGGFGGADAKALMVMAILYPTYPVFYGPGLSFPLVRSAAGLFALTILTNAVLVGAIYPIGLALRNASKGRFGLRVFVGRPVRVQSLTGRHGRLLETPRGFSRTGLDLDALRMYLRWRGESIESIRAMEEDPSDPSTLPESFNDPTDGAVEAESGSPPAVEDDTFDEDRGEDPWGARRFLDSIAHDAYGTDPEQLRDGLALVVERERIWISPGIPFLVPLTIGLVIAFVYGDVLIGVLQFVGLT